MYKGKYKVPVLHGVSRSVQRGKRVQEATPANPINVLSLYGATCAGTKRDNQAEHCNCPYRTSEPARSRMSFLFLSLSW